MDVTKDAVKEQFGRQSHEYAISKGHAQGDDLGILIELLKPAPHMRLLDIATGAGHTAAAIAPLVSSVVASDLTEEMIAETQQLFSKRGLANAEAVVMDAEALQFPAASFDAVTCRIAPHHFINIEKAVAEIGRVLKPGGVFALEDSISPRSRRLDQFINGVEKLRDATHVRSYSLAEWRKMLAANAMSIRRTRLYRKTHDIADWIRRSGINAEETARVYAAFLSASPQAKQHYELVFDGDRALTFTDDKIILRAVKRRNPVRKTPKRSR